MKTINMVLFDEIYESDIFTDSVVMSKRLDRRRRRLTLFRLRKYFWAWLATWVGVRVFTKFLEIPLQSPLPTFCNPKRNSLCSSSVQGTPNQHPISTQLSNFFIKKNLVTAQRTISPQNSTLLRSNFPKNLWSLQTHKLRVGTIQTRTLLRDLLLSA